MPLRFRSIKVGLFVGAVLTCTLGIYGPSRGGPNDDVAVAESLSTLLQVARTVVSRHQNEINNPDVGDKGFTGAKVLAETVGAYKDKTGLDPDHHRPIVPSRPFAACADGFDCRGR